MVSGWNWRFGAKRAWGFCEADLAGGRECLAGLKNLPKGKIALAFGKLASLPAKTLRSFVHIRCIAYALAEN